MKMALRYWVYSALALVGALSMLAGIAWLDRATGAPVEVASTTPPSQILSTFPSPFEKRQDVDALLAIDFSGSMNGQHGEPPTDPDELRLQAAELMIASLAADVFPRATHMGYIAFGTDALLIQSLSLVEDLEVRKTLISQLRKPSYSDYTNIAAALSVSYDQLFPEGRRASSNIPALVLLTDGDPRGGEADNNETGIRKAVQNLTDKGTIIFVVILRNPDPSNESPRLSEWRRIWKSIADSNPNLNYLEAQRADELEGIYNKIRARLVNEGARPGERSSYDPRDADAVIEMPPNLLQAHLLVGKPSAASHIELTAPDGTSFTKMALQESRNEVMVGDLYYRYKIYLPMEGHWRLETNTQKTIYYLLNAESLYSARIAWPAGSPYVSPNSPTPLPLVVIDENGNPTSKRFSLEASILRSVERTDGAIVEQEIALPMPQHQPSSQIYKTVVSPEVIGTDESIILQVSGQASDGTLVNVSLTRLPVARPPTDAILQVPSQVTCSDEKLQWWPPRIKCGNMVTVTLRVQGVDHLLASSLSGEIFPPGQSTGIAMQAVDRESLQGIVGPLTAAGSYGIAAEASGKVEKDLVWKEWTETKVELVWPAWVEQWRRQFFIGFVLLAICALWKPLIVALLLPLFRLFRLAPSGFYAVSGDNYSDSVYRTAMRRRNLFALTVGRWENKSLDVRVDDGFRPETGRYRRGIFRMLPDVNDWLYRRPLARLIAVPLRGLYAETCDGLEQAPDRRPMRVRVGRTTLLVCQSDWTDQQR